MMRRVLALSFIALLSAGCVTTDLSGARLPASQGNLREAARLNTQLGVDYIRKGQFDAAQEKLERAISQDPNLATAFSSLALVYAQNSEFVKAETSYRKAIALDGNDPSVRNNFGVFLCGRGKIAEAEKYLLQAATDPRYGTPAAAWTNAGVCARRIPDLIKADRYFREALKIDPQFPDALANLAWLSLQKKDYLRTRAFLQRYEKVGPPTAEALSVGVQAEAALGDAAAARSYRTRLIKQFPESDESSRLQSKPRS